MSALPKLVGDQQSQVLCGRASGQKGMRGKGPLLVVAICLLVQAWGACPAATIRSRPLELTGTEQKALGQLACYGEPQSIVAQRYLGPLYGDYVDVQCKSHSEYQGHPVARFVRCSRPKVDTRWACDSSIATLELNTNGRTISVRHLYVTTQDALDVVSYLLSGPSKDEVRVDPDWITAVTWVSRGADHVTVSGDSHIIRVRVQPAGLDRFLVEGISSCSVDICHSITAP
jgi:hypothetical protein